MSIRNLQPSLMHKNHFIILITAILCSCTGQVREEQPPTEAKNIILFIGDGMGLSQVSASFFFKRGPVNFDRFARIGLIKTSSSSHKITDSASGATAFSTGKKTYNGAIGVDPDTIACPTILEILSQTGYSTGVIATSSITHATPASFYSHVKSRMMHEEIAAQLVGSEVDYFAGGGSMFFSNRPDGINYFDSLTSKGFDIDTVSLAPEVDFPQKYGYLLAPNGMPKMVEGRGDFLAQATRQAIEYLSQDPDGFFLMVEGSQIDWGGHENNSAYLISELIDFDEAIGVGLDFAEKDQNTLVIVTADHETGGFTLSAQMKQSDDTSMMGVYSDYDSISPTFSTGGHSAALIPVFASGPGSDAFSGIYENTAIFDKMMEAVGGEAAIRRLH